MKGSRHLTIVIKLGTSSIVDETTHQPLLSNLSLIVETAVKLRRHGHRVVIVSSGAIGVGLQRMDMEKKPKHLPQAQALAAVGQCRLMSLWDSLFTHLGQPVAQILLTRNDIADRTQYLNAQNTFSELLAMNVIPIVNENDTLAVSEIKFGDNDTLSAITAAMVQAEYLFLMTDVDCLYTTNPRIDPHAKPIAVVSDLATLAADVSSAGSSLGTGGMSTKLTAARLATAAGVTTVITRASKPGNVWDIVNHLEVLSGHALSSSEIQTLPRSPSLTEPSATVPLHTRFLPLRSPIRDRSFWIQYGLAPHGTIYIDEGAYRALRAKAGLLPVGVVDVEGSFAQQEAVRVVVVTVSGAPSRASVDASPRTPEDTPGHTPSGSTIISRPSSPRPFTPQAAALSAGGMAGYETGILDHAISGSMTSPTSAPHTPKPMPALAATSSSPALGGLSAHPSSANIHELRSHPTWTNPREVGRALVNYSAVEVALIKGRRSAEISRVLGYADSDYVALRENISLLAHRRDSTAGVKPSHKEADDTTHPHSQAEAATPSRSQGRDFGESDDAIQDESVDRSEANDGNPAPVQSNDGASSIMS